MNKMTIRVCRLKEPQVKCDTRDYAISPTEGQIGDMPQICLNADDCSFQETFELKKLGEAKTNRSLLKAYNTLCKHQ